MTTLVVRHAAHPDHRGSQGHGRCGKRLHEADRRPAHVVDAHHLRHVPPLLGRHHERGRVPVAGRGLEDLRALLLLRHPGRCQDVRDDVVRRVQVVEDDGGLGVTRREGGRDSRRHRHDVRHAVRRVLQQSGETARRPP